MQGPEPVLIRSVEAHDLDAWVRLRADLWPEDAAEAHRREAESWLSRASAKGDVAAFLALDPTGNPIGFAEASLRDSAEGCEGRKVAYLEGWFVVAEARRSGVGGALVGAVEDWGRRKGCRELASDTELENVLSREAHLALGFEEVSVIRCFKRSLFDSTPSGG